MIIRAKTFAGWLKHNFTKHDLENMAYHGARCGWHGLIYTCDISKLYQKFKQELWEYLVNESMSYGSHNVFEFMSLFQGAKHIKCDADFETLIVHYVAESMAYQLTECE